MKKEATAIRTESTKKATSAEIVLKVSELLKSEGATGYVCGIVGSDSKVIPYVGASSVGDLLTIKYVIEKEISKLIDGQASTREDSATSPQ